MIHVKYSIIVKKKKKKKKKKKVVGMEIKIS